MSLLNHLILFLSLGFASTSVLLDDGNTKKLLKKLCVASSRWM
jgi:hypothetical protein